jgi:tetratricopeptide (TPR) repeat protein
MLTLIRHTAIKKYQEAATLIPDDVSPLGNISAAYFEVRKYTQCITRAQRALELPQGLSEDKSTQVQKFERRIAKANAHLSTVSEEEELNARVKILKGLGRHRPSMYSSVEYYTVGHDEISNLFDKDLVKASSKEDNVSLFLGGVGDARHLYRTIIGIAEHEKKSTTKKKYYFTIIDINKCALARDLVVMMLLDDLSNLDDMDYLEAVEHLTTVYFILIGTMMPRFAFELLHETIDRAFEAIQEGNQSLSWLYLHEADKTLYAEALTIWKGPPLEIFKNSDVIQHVTSQVAQNYMP